MLNGDVIPLSWIRILRIIILQHTNREDAWVINLMIENTLAMSTHLGMTSIVTVVVVNTGPKMIQN